MPLPNATVSTTRAGAAHYSGRRVQIAFPTAQQRIMAQGEDLAPMLYDVPAATYRRGDIVTLTALDGAASLPPDTTFVVGLVTIVGAAAGAPLATLSVELTTVDR